MMSEPMKRIGEPVLLSILTLCQVPPVLIGERRIREIVKAEECFRVAVRINNGEGFLKGSVLEFCDTPNLKDKTAEIKGVIGIEILATSLAEKGSS